MYTVRFNSIITALILCFVVIGPVVGGVDVGYVTLENEFQQKVLKSIVERAFTRDGNRILCALNSNQINLLSQSGLQIEPILSDVDPETTYLIRRSPKAEMSHIDVKSISDIKDIGRERYLSKDLSNSTAKALTDDPFHHATPLADLEVRIIYLPPVFTNIMSQVDDFPSDSVATLVSMDSLYAFDTRLEDFETRYIFTDSIDRARDWIVSKFQAWGYTDVTTPDFDYSGELHYNVMAIKPGYAEPDKVIVIGGHYDSITYGQAQGPFIFAPGADDNASGTALTMEMARIFANIPFRKTIIFMPFSAEEVGLVGARNAAADFIASGTDLEVMLNYDMVAHDPGNNYIIDVSSGSNNAYAKVSVDAAARVTSLTALLLSAGSSSDHAAFMEQGFNIINNIENNFNFTGWHTNLDISSRLNYPYYTEVAKMAAATLAIIADAAHITEITGVTDQGDGQSVELNWSDCDPTYEYSVWYEEGSTTVPPTQNEIVLPSGTCSYVLPGLTEGLDYRVSVVGKVAGGYPAIYGNVVIVNSFINPRVPDQLTVNPGLNQLFIDWSPNHEADLSHYRLFRSESTSHPFVLYQDNITDTFYVDNAVTGQTGYRYKIAAVDTDLNESALSEEKVGVPATFDGGILVVDEIATSWGVPDESGQVDFFNSLFDITPISIFSVNFDYTPLTRNEAGQYSSIFWFDDDISSIKFIEHSNDTLDWFLNYPDNMLISGFMTLTYWGTEPYSTGDVLYDEFGLVDFTAVAVQDFQGASGMNGWPDIEVDLTNVLGYLPYIPTMVKRGTAEIIYTYDSKDDDPSREGLPCALLMDTPNGKRVLLGFPLLHMTDASAKALIDHAKALFGEDVIVYTPGDVNRNGAVNISDLTYLVAYLFGIPSGPAPTVPNLADVNSNCEVNISDITYLVAYLFGVPTGPAPTMGCMN